MSDWQILDRLSSIKAAYGGRGDYVSMTRENLVIDSIAVGTPLVGSRRLLLRLPTDGDFAWFATSVHELTPDDQTAGVMIRWQLQGSHQTLGDHRAAAGLDTFGWLPLDNVVGRDSQPFPWPYPIIFPRSDRLTLDIDHPVSTETAYYVLHGFKLIPGPLETARVTDA